MMKPFGFYEMDKAIDVLYDQERYEEALELFRTSVPELPPEEADEFRFELMWIECMLYTRCGKYDECFKVIKQAVDNGLAFPLHFDRFDPLRNMDGFKALEEHNAKLVALENSKAKTTYKVLLPENYDPNKKYPLFMALHGDGISNIREFSQYWKPDVFLSSGFIFAYLQSSQVICHNGYGWLDDPDKANKDILSCYSAIANAYSVDPDRVLIGGFSGGAIESIHFTLSDVLPVKGFIALCPELIPKAFTYENVNRAAQAGVKGAVMEGELVLPVANEDEMMRTFDELGLPIQYTINKGIGHQAPDDFDVKLGKAISFILA